MGKAGGSKADTAVKLVLIFFISLLSFSVGTYVGKQVSDSDARRAALEVDGEGGHGAEAAHGEEAATAPISDEDTASLQEEFLQKERQVASEEVLTDAAKAKIDNEHGDDGHGAAGQEKSEEGYTHRSKMKAEGHEAVIAYNTDEHGHKTHAEHEAAVGHGAKAEKAKAATAHDEHAEEAAHAAPKATATSAANEHGAPEVSKAADRVAHDQAPAADLKKKREPSSVLPSVASTAVGKYTVQVASYATEGEAKDQAAKLTSKGYSAFYVPAEVNNKTWYRVSVGLFSDQKSATNYRTELLATQAVASAIVQKIVK